jgi:hypothetical protein
MVPEWLSDMALHVSACGSRVTVDPPPTGSDHDFLVLIERSERTVADVVSRLSSDGFAWEGNEHYQNAMGNFMSWRKGNLNLIVTSNPDFVSRHLVATKVCTALNLRRKADRVMVFQAVLYGEYVDD